MMLKRILCVIFSVFVLLAPCIGHSAEMVNVEYIHSTLNWRWGIDLPRNPLTNPYAAANMKYLLTVVDIANEYLNNEKTTDYGNSEYATLAAADTVAASTAIDTLVRGPGFYLTTTTPTTSFGITISAAGNFAIDWGDGTRESIVDKPVGAKTYTHTFGNPSRAHTIRITGTATDYMPETGKSPSVMSFSSKPNIGRIYGNLGHIFPTLADGRNPKFQQLFQGASNMTGEIPAGLFDGIHGAADWYMFANLFQGCSNLTGEIPPDLFGGITEITGPGIFEGTFRDCKSLTGAIPSELFSRISGETDTAQFNMTFRGCAGLSGTIPGDLFQGIHGRPQEALFFATFRNCSGITGSIPGELFAGISGAPAESAFADTFAYMGISGQIPGELFAGVRGAPAHQIFSYTFAGNRKLTGPIPADLFAGISGAPATNMFASTFHQCSGLGRNIPAGLFAGIRGEPASAMFDQTFSDAGVTSVPSGLFAGISGAPATSMFANTFSWNYSLTAVPADLFSGISGEPAPRMYAGTFFRTGLRSIPTGLFGDISGQSADDMFLNTFANCTSLTGPSAQMPDGQYLYNAFPDVTADMATYAGATGLDDYDEIPDNWK